MIILPLSHEEATIKRLPVVTITIIGLCIIIFFSTSTIVKNQTENLKLAEANINKLKLNLYLKYTQEKVGSPIEALIDPTSKNRYEVNINLMSNISKFWEEFTSGKIVPKDHEDFLKWKELEKVYNKIKNKHIHIRFGFKPTKPTWYTFITSLFLHADFFHILGNLFFLWLVGCNFEDRIGRFPFALFYLFSGITSSLVHMSIYPQSNVPCIGASGAVSGAIGAFLVYFSRTKIRFFYLWIIFIRPIYGTFYLPAFIAIPLWFLNQLFMGLMTVNDNQTDVAFWAHIGGFIFGLLIALLLKYSKLEKKLNPDLEEETEFIPNWESKDLEKNPQKIDTKLIEMLLKGDFNSRKEAVKLYESVVKQYPELELSNKELIALAKVYEKNRNYNQALNLYNKVINSSSKEDEVLVTTLYNSAKIYRDVLKDLEKSKSLFEEILIKYPKSPLTLLVKSDLLKIDKD